MPPGPSLVIQVGANIDRLKTEMTAGKTTLETFQQSADKAGGRLMDLGEKGQAAVPHVGSLSDQLRGFDGILATMGIHIRHEIASLEELGATSGKSAFGLGKLETAGLAVGAGMAAWGITRAAMQFFELDGAVQKAWTSLLGFGDDAAERAGAKADVLARASKNAGHEITNLAEAIKINADAADDLSLKWGRSANAARDTAIAISGWQKEIRTVRSTGDFPALTADLESQNFSLEKLSKKYGIHVDALQYLQRQIAATSKAQGEADALAVKGQAAVEAAAKAAEVFRQERWKTQLELDVKIRESTAKQTAAYLKLTNEGVLAELAAQTALNKVWGLDAAGAIAHEITAAETLENTLHALRLEQEQGHDTTKRVAMAQYDYGKSLLDAAVADDTARDARAKGNTELAKTPAVVKAAGSSVNDLADTFSRAAGVIVGGLTAIDTAQMPRNMRPGEAPIETAAEFVSRTIRSGTPTRDSGGPVSAGQPYYVGRGAQPELFVPSSAGAMYPAGSSGGGSSVTNIYITQPLGTPATIAAAVKDALVEARRTSGVRMPVGA